MIPLSELMATKVPSLNPANFKDEEFELWSIPAFDKGEPEHLSGGEIGSSKKIIQTGDVLLSRIVPHIRRAWVVTANRDGLRQIGSGEWIVFRSKRFDPNFLRHFLTSDPFHSQFMQTVAGVGGSLVRARPEGVKEIEIPLPPLEEQKSIAAILDQADDIRRKRQHAIDRLNQLGRAIFHEMFGDPAIRTVSLGEVCQFQYGNSLPASIRDGVGYDVYGSNGVVGSHNEGLTTGPTVIIGRKGSVGEINFSDSSCWPIDTTYYVDSGSTQQNLRWLFYALKNLKLQALNKATGVPGLNRNDAYRLEIPLPPLKEQKLFADRVKEIDVFMVRMAETLSANDSLFASLQHRAFTGQL